MSIFKILFLSEKSESPSKDCLLAQQFLVIAPSVKSALSEIQYRPSGPYRAYGQKQNGPVISDLDGTPEFLASPEAILAMLMTKNQGDSFALLEIEGEDLAIPSSGISELDGLPLPITMISQTLFEINGLKFEGEFLPLARLFYRPDEEEYVTFGVVDARAGYSPCWVDCRLHHLVYDKDGSAERGVSTVDLVVYLGGVSQNIRESDEELSLRTERVSKKILGQLKQLKFWTHVVEVKTILNSEQSRIESVVYRTNIPFASAKNEILS